MQRPLAIAISLLCAASAYAVEPDAKSLLRSAATQHRDAKSFRIEWETKITVSTPYSNSWQKQMYLVAAADHKYRWEARGSTLRGMRINDGQNDWFYRPTLREYSVQSADPTKPRPEVRARSGTAGGTTDGWIRSSMQSLLRLDDDADAAEMRAQEVLTIGSTKLPCYVVRAFTVLSYREGLNSTRENTYWIDKNTGLVRKAILSTRGPVSANDDVDDQMRSSEIVYTRVELNTAPDPTLFAFTPPTNAYLVDDARQPMARPLTVGTPAPALKLNDKNGVAFDLADAKGKVAIVQYWASWCGACLDEMKALAKLPRAYTDKGLVTVSVDEDEVPEHGDRYFAAQKFDWKNLHDTGEIHRKAWGVAGFPYLVLVDRGGKTAWISSGLGTGFLDALLSQLSKPDLGLAP